MISVCHAGLSLVSSPCSPYTYGSDVGHTLMEYFFSCPGAANALSNAFLDLLSDCVSFHIFNKCEKLVLTYGGTHSTIRHSFMNLPISTNSICVYTYSYDHKFAWINSVFLFTYLINSRLNRAVR